MNKLKIHEYAKLIYGPRWKKNLADDIGYHETTVVKWFSGVEGYKEPQDIRKTLLKKLKEQKNKINKAIKELLTAP